MASKTVKLTIRVPEEVYEEVKKKAKAKNRSINGQVLRYVFLGLRCRFTCTQKEKPSSA